MKITSRDNPKIKRAGLVRAGRIADKIFVEGRRLCEEVLRSGLQIEEIFVSESFVEKNGDFLKNFRGANSFTVGDKVFGSLSETKTSQGVIIIARKPNGGKNAIESNLKKADCALVILLHQINNPANLGAILRTAEAAGAHGIITSKNSTDVFSPKSLRGSMGAAFRLPIWTNADYFEALEWAAEFDLKSVCADVESKKSYTQIDWKTGSLLVLGSEGHGLSAAERRATNESLIIPMENDVESLNIAVACGVILFEARRQRVN